MNLLDDLREEAAEHEAGNVCYSAYTADLLRQAITEIERLQAIVRRFVPPGMPVFCIDPTGEVIEVYVEKDLTCASAVFDNQSYEAAEIPLQNCYPTLKAAEAAGGTKRFAARRTVTTSRD